jgi:hypothetical protein
MFKIQQKTICNTIIVRREQKEETVPAERAALRFAPRAWPGA